MAGNCETITNSASAEARVEALAELGNKETHISFTHFLHYLSINIIKLT